MENAAEALKLAAWVLIIVLALSVSMNAITLIKNNIDDIITINDREFLTKYVEGNRDENGNLVTKRLVSAETIVNTIYRNYKEKWKIVFTGNGIGSNYLFTPDPDANKNPDGSNKKDYELIRGNELDMDVMSFSDDETKDLFIKRIMMGGNTYLSTDEKNRFGNKIKQFSANGLYNIIENKKFIESIGIYYTEEISNSSAPKTQMTEKRVITYTVQ